MAASVGSMQDNRRIDLSQDEDALRAPYERVPERAVAEAATACLSVVIDPTEASGYAKRWPEASRRRAIVLLAIRLLRAIGSGPHDRDAALT